MKTRNSSNSIDFALLDDLGDSAPEYVRAKYDTDTASRIIAILDNEVSKRIEADRKRMERLASHRGEDDSEERKESDRHGR